MYRAQPLPQQGTLTQADLDNTVNLIRARAGVKGKLDMATANANPEPWIKGCYPYLAKLNPANLGVILEIRRERTVELVMEGFRYYDIMRWKEGSVFNEEFLGMYIAGPGPIDVSGDGKADFYIKTKGDTATPAAGLEVLNMEDGKVTLVTPNASGANTYNGESGYLTTHTLDVLTRQWNEDRDYLYPIPTKERILTNGVLTQNPGWEDGLGL